MKNTSTSKKGVMNWIIFVFLALYAVSMILLLVWGVFTSLKTRDDFYSNKVLWPKDKLEFNNFAVVWKNFFVTATNVKGQKISIDFWGQTFNTIVYAAGSAFIITLAYCITSYLCAKYKYFFSKIVYTIVVVTMVVPIIGSTPTMLWFLKKIHLYDTWLGNFITKFNFLGMYFLIFHAAFENISNDFYEAATIDGAGELQIFVRIMIPLILPTFNMIFLIKFIEFWNDYQTSLLFMPTHPTLAYGTYVMSISNINGLSSSPIRLASCILMATPIFILFIVLKNKIMGNLTMGGVKE